MKKYNILTAEVDAENKDEFRFAAIRGTDDSIVFNFENCTFKEVDDATEFIANLILLEQQDGELVHLDKNDPRVPDLTKESDEILRQFVEDLGEKLNVDVNHIVENA